MPSLLHNQWGFYRENYFLAAAAEWFAEKENAEQYENECEQQKSIIRLCAASAAAGNCGTGIICTASMKKAMFARMTGCAGDR